MTSIAVFGSHPLGEQCLDILVDHPEVSVPLVVTYPPEADNWWTGSMYDRAREHGLEVVPIASERAVLDYDVDYLLSVYYPNILGPELLEHPRVAPVNVHQAELPRYRGSNVFSHAIMNARPDDHWKYGTTMHVMAEEVDAGDVIDRAFVPIREEDTARTLYERVSEASVELFERVLPSLLAEEVHEIATPQSEFEGKRYFYTKESLDGQKEIDPARLQDPEAALSVYDKVRALDFPPHEPAYVAVGDRKLYLTKTSYEDLCEPAAAPTIEIPAVTR